MIVLGIETSCDETSVAIVKKKNRLLLGNVLSENTQSQIKKHIKFGGVVPELASREHSDTLNNLVKKTLKDSGVVLGEIDAFAATVGPGLLGGLIVGSNYAKTLSLVTKKPFIAINHLQGHILVTRMKQKVKFPFLCLLVSGGHTQLLLVKKYNNFKLIGETLDDALGEAFDKVAKLMGYSYPGGPTIEKLALKANKKINFNLPEPLIRSKDFNFSFSGIKTATRKIIKNSFDKRLKYELAKNFQDCVTNCLITKCSKAIDLYKKKEKINSFVLAGGVASNKFIRKKFTNLCSKKLVQFIVPEQDLCVDNATMIAWAAIERLQSNKKSDILDFEPKPRWALESL